MIDLLQKHLLPIDTPGKKQLELRCAAVAVLLVKDQTMNQWQILLTRRAEHLKHHPGQISFPGGSFESSDINLSHTAIRETYEEVGISPDLIKLLGQLPQQQTTSQYNITPYVGIIHSDYQLTIDLNEVAETFTIPLEFATNEENYQKVNQTINGCEYNYYVIQYKHYKIWGATAKILLNLTRRINRKSE